jgi:hypothetical protein
MTDHEPATADEINQLIKKIDAQIENHEEASDE